MSENQRSENRVFLERVWAACLRIMALGLFMVLHHFLNVGLHYVVPSNLVGSTVWIEDVIYLVFLMVYIFLAWDMFTVFVPSLKRFSYPGQETSASEIADEN